MALAIELTKQNSSRFFDRRVFIVDKQENILEVGIAQRKTGGVTKYKIFFIGDDFTIYTTDRNLKPKGPLKGENKILKRILNDFNKRNFENEGTT